MTAIAQTPLVTNSANSKEENRVSVLFSINGNTSFDELKKLRSCLETRQGSISCYHAGKQFDDFGYHDGLKAGSCVLIRELARNVFRVADSGAQKIIHETIDNYKAKLTGQLHYCLDRRILQREYHYLYFGSESLLVLADQLKAILPKHNFRMMLINSGRPVIVNFTLRIAELSKTELEEIAGILEKAMENRYRDPFLRKSFVHYGDVGTNKVLSIKKVKLPVNVKNLPES